MERPLEVAWEANPFNGTMVDEIAFHLANTVDGSDDQVNSFMSFLFGMGPAFLSTEQQGKAFTATRLIQCLSLAGLMRRSSDLAKVVKKSIYLVLPARVAKVVEQTFLANTRIPDAGMCTRVCREQSC